MNQSASNTPPLAETNVNASTRTNISIKLPVMVVSLLLFAFTIYTFISIRITQGSATDALQRDLSGQVNTQAELIKNTLIETRTVAINLATAAESATYNEEEILKLIENTLQKNEKVFGSTIAYQPRKFDPSLYYWAPYYNRTPENNLVFTQLGTPEYDYFSKEWYTLPRERREAVLSEPYFDFGGGNIWMVTWSAPFYDNVGNFLGVATVDIGFAQTQEIVSNIQVGNLGYAFLIDKNGTILGIQEGLGLYEVMVDSIASDAFALASVNWGALVSEMTQEKTGFIEVTDARGNQQFIAYTPIGLGTGWSLALAYPREEILEITTRLQTTLITYTVLISLIFGFIVYLFTRSITNPLNKLTQAASRIASENPETIKNQLAEPIEINTQDELEDLALAFNQMAVNLKQSLENLEEKVTERTAGLERLATDLTTVADVAREIAVIRDLDTLLNVSASLIRERLGYYHVGIFLVDERRENAVLRAASSNAAERMLAANYKLRVGKTGLVGNVTQTGQAYIALDTGADAVHFENPYLPETRSEIALPLRSRSITFGALDIQASVPNAFGLQEIQTLQILADQLAAAIENAQLVEQVENALEELSKTSRETTRQLWESVMSERNLPAYEYDGLQVRPIPQDLPADLLAQLGAGRPIITRERSEATSPNTLLFPIVVSGQVIGVMGLEHEQPDQTWTDEEMAVAQAAVNRASLTLENARLLDESLRLAAKQRTIFESTTRIGSGLSIESILQTTVEELERVLRGSEVTLQFTDVKDDQK